MNLCYVFSSSGMVNIILALIFGDLKITQQHQNITGCQFDKNMKVNK